MRNSLDHNESGMTLVEILISMLIGAVLLAGVLSIFINSKQTYQRQEGMSRIQENGRFALDFIAHDLRMGDFWGCMRRDAGGPNNNINLGALATTYDYYGAGGFDGTDGGVAGNRGQDGSDTLIIRGITSAGVFLTADNGVTLTTAAAHGFNPNDFLFVTNCNNGDIFQASAGTANVSISHVAGGVPGNSVANLSAAYGTDAQVYSLSTIVYSIANGASGLPSLFRSTNGLNQELIEGVENMQVLYGEDTDADGASNHYVPWSAALNMNQVISARISLLLQSTANNIASQNTAVVYNDPDLNGPIVATSVADRRLRRVVTSTITLRNRLR
jgi:type IV pilus assembly protein PilW